MSSRVRSVFELELKDNDLAQVGATIDLLIVRLPTAVTVEEEHRLRFALQELLINAIEHGNLDVSHREKQEALNNGTYEKLLDARREDSIRGKRLVIINIVYDSEEGMLHYRICDQGDGFDWRRALESLPPREEDVHLSGRGVWLVHSFYPTLQYNDRGNEVQLTLQVSSSHA